MGEIAGENDEAVPLQAGKGKLPVKTPERRHKGKCTTEHTGNNQRLRLCGRETANRPYSSTTMVLPPSFSSVLFRPATMASGPQM